MPTDPASWLLTASPAGDGKPWGFGTNMAGRAADPSAQPWDVGCKVKSLIGGYEAMTEMLASLEELISKVDASKSPGQRGHVYIAGWRFNCQRDLSSDNSWGTGAWNSTSTVKVDNLDRTAVGLILRLMQAGIAVRILVWQPTPVQVLAAEVRPHMEDHTYLWRVVQEENIRLKSQTPAPVIPLGIVALDMRTADGAVSGSHHQKMMVIRSPSVNVAFCGGVDLAFTRRDAPSDPTQAAEAIMNGDWESSASIPTVGRIFQGTSCPQGIMWPPDAKTIYTSADKVNPFEKKQSSDLPADNSDKAICIAIGGNWNNGKCTFTPSGGTSSNTPLSIYGAEGHRWHDQHLKLEGPIVSTLEWQFYERWIDTPNSNLLTLVDQGRGTVSFSSDEALDANKAIVPLETPTDEPAVSGTSSVVQMWRTIPMRTRSAPLFREGEFTVMSGLNKAISTATELIWIFDQYFWSEPTARLLNYRLQNSQNLCVILVLPPFSDGTYPEVHRARQLALAELTRGLSADQRARVAIYNMWYAGGDDASKAVGIYVHAKVQMYDGALLVIGSANLNRRSLSCDSELSCAIADAAVVADHQQRLWKLLFGGTAWPGLDLNQSGNGKAFFTQFAAASKTSGSNLISDPWDDANPLNPVLLPTKVPRPVAFLGPKYEIYYDGALDPGSMDPTVENDIVDSQNLPRAARLDDIVNRIENVFKKSSGNPTRFPKRKQASILRGQLIHLAGTSCPADGYNFTECAEWWKEMCEGFPCFLPLGWPGYQTAIVNTTIDGKDIVIQLWRGWCQRFFGINGMMGGVGAEVGIYRKIPGQFQKFLDQFPKTGILDGFLNFFNSQVGGVPAGYFDQKFFNYADDTFWWPYPELNAQVEFTLKNANTGAVFFKAGPEKTYWLCKWMDPNDYDNKYQTDSTNRAPKKEDSWNYTLEFTVTGNSSQPYSDVWTVNDGKQSFGGPWP